MAAILGALAGLGAVASLIYGIFKWAVWKTATTPEEKKEKIDKEVSDEKTQVEKTGRPQ